MGGVMMVDTMRASQGGLIPFLQTPVMSSFMHRSFLGFLVSVAVMIVVSLFSQKPSSRQIEGVCFEWSGLRPVQESRIFSDYRTWSILLAVTVLTCWIMFR